MKRRHVLSVLGLSFVTLGIYSIYWLYKTRQEILQFSPDKKAIPRLIVLFIPVFILIGGVIIAGIALTSQSDRLAQDQVAATTLFSVVTIGLALIGVLAILIVSFWWFYKYFTTLEKVVRGSDAMLLYTLWVILSLFGLGPIWVLMVQSDLNKFIDNGYRPLRAWRPGDYPQAQDEQQAWPQPQPPQPGPYPPQFPMPLQPHPQPEQPGHHPHPQDSSGPQQPPQPPHQPYQG